MGVRTAEFAIDIGSDANAKECFCRDPPDECPIKGTFHRISEFCHGPLILLVSVVTDYSTENS